MKRKGCSVLLTLAMLLGLLPTTALAANTVNLTKAVLDSTENDYNQQNCYWLQEDAVTYKLMDDITIDKPICIGVSPSHSPITVTFDLNGHTLKMTESSGNDYDATNNALNIGHYLTTNGDITDGYADVTIKGGTIEGGYYSVKVSPYADCTMESGAITGAASAGVFTDDDASNSNAIKLGEFIMKGGEISGNPIGIVCCGKLTLNDGKITANDSYGVHLTTYRADSSDNTLFGIFTMNDGEISENGEDGVRLSASQPRSVQFTMEGGTIRGNQGYGVSMNGNPTEDKVTISGGSISSNETGGIYYEDGKLYMNRAANIKGNAVENGKERNVYLVNEGNTDKYIHLPDNLSLSQSLSEGAYIGVTFKNPPDEGSSVTVLRYGGTGGSFSGYFQSDDPLYEVYASDADTISLKLKAHTWSDWEKSDDIYHKRKCTDVGCRATEQEAHSGGTADCTHKATCTVCNSEYGKYKHSGTLSDYKWDENNHWQEYSCCKAKVNEGEHTGGKADCTKQAECEICKQPYGAKNPANHPPDGGYGLDDWKGHDENYHWRVMDCCGENLTDTKELHSSDNATCLTKAICKACGVEYSGHSGALDTPVWKTDANKHWHAYTCCGAKADEAAHVYDNTSDATCNICGYTRKIDSGNTPGSGTSSGGSSSGGSSSVDSSYKVSRDETSNGTIASSRTGAKRGETVILTLTPDEGYALESLRVLDSKGNEIALEKLDDGSYRFVMPSGDVDVSASYVKIADAAPASQEKTLIFTIGSSTVLENEKVVSHDAAPKIRGNRTVLPVRAVAEALGADVAWDDTQRKITVTKGDAFLEIFIGRAFALVNGEQIAIDTPAFIENDRAYLPLRFIAEQLGADVAWDQAAQQVVIRHFG